MIAEYDGLGNLVAEYVYGNNQRLARINSDKTIDYYLNDHPAKAGQAPGSARTMTSSVWSANYYPFGEIASQTGSPEDTRYDYTGQGQGRRTGLIYFGVRYYRSKAEIRLLTHDQGLDWSINPLLNGIKFPPKVDNKIPQDDNKFLLTALQLLP